MGKQVKLPSNGGITSVPQNDPTVHVVIVQPDGSQKRVTPIATLGNFVLVQHNREQFYVPINNPGAYMYSVTAF